MGAVNVGSASVTITPTMSGFGSKINKELGSAGTSGGAAFSKAFSGKAASSAGSIVSRYGSAGSSAGSRMGTSIGAALSAKGAAIAGIAMGLFHIIPVVGVWAAAFLAVALAVFTSPALAVWTLLVAVVAMNVTDNLVGPIQVHPVLSFVAISCGQALAGIPGMIVAVPLCAALKGGFIYFFERRTGRQIVSYDGVLFQSTPFTDSEGEPAPSTTTASSRAPASSPASGPPRPRRPPPMGIRRAGSAGDAEPVPCCPYAQAPRGERHMSPDFKTMTTAEIREGPDPVLDGVVNTQINILGDDSSATSAVTGIYGSDPVQAIIAIVQSGQFGNDMYLSFLESENGLAGYRAFFQKLLGQKEGEALLWHCTGGKDRAGTAAVLLLSALLTAGYLMPIVLRGFFPGKDAQVGEKCEASASMLIPMLVLTVLSVALGMFPSLLTGLLSPILTALL